MACIIVGGFYAVDWAESLAMFYTIIMIMLSPLLPLIVSYSVSNDENAETLKKLWGRRYLWRFTAVTTVIELIAIAAAGWLFLAVFYFIAFMCVLSARQTLTDHFEKEEKAD